MLLSVTGITRCYLVNSEKSPLDDHGKIVSRAEIVGCLTGDLGVGRSAIWRESAGCAWECSVPIPGNPSRGSLRYWSGSARRTL